MSFIHNKANRGYMPPIGTTQQLNTLLPNGLGLSPASVGDPSTGTAGNTLFASYNGPGAPATPATTDTTAAPTTTAGTTDPNASYWATQNNNIDNQLSRLGDQQNIGQGNILRSYQAAFDQLTNGRNQAQGQYTTNRNNEIVNNQNAKGQIDANTHGTLTGLQRLLGAQGAGDSSASSILAPYAAGLQGNIARGNETQAYEKNMNALDQGWQNADQQYTNDFGKLGVDKTNRENALLGGIASTRQNLLNTKQQIAASQGLAQDPAIAQQIADLTGQINNYGQQQTFDPGTVAYQAPNLAKYDTGNTIAPSNVSPNIAQNLGAYSYLLGDQNKQKNGAQLLGIA